MPSSQLTYFGPPGTGKTTTLLRLVERKLKAGVPPERLSFVSFTKQAADGARDRAVEEFGLEAKRFKYFRTIHSLAFQQLQLRKTDVMRCENWEEVAELTGVPFSGTYNTSLNDMKQATVGDKILFYIGLARAQCQDPRAHFDKLGTSVLEDRVEWRTYMHVLSTLDKYKASNALVDFTDMLDMAVENLSPLDVDVAIVDEAQDLSLLQWKVIDTVFADVPELYIAGDDDQAIFEWSGGAVSEFQRRAALGAIQVLDHSYRLPELVWKYAQLISSRIRHRQPKTWGARNERGVLNTVPSLSLIDFKESGDWMVLGRTKYVGNLASEHLLRRGIPHTLFGQDLVSRGDVRAIDAWERLQGGRAVLWEQALDLFKRLRPGTVADKAIEALRECDTDATFSMQELRDKFSFKANLKHKWNETWQQDFRIPAARVGLYRNLIVGGWDLHAPSRIHVNTMHGVKGGEADHVVVLPTSTRRVFRGMTRPGANHDDEHRVHYVATTRAKKSLHVGTMSSKFRYPYPRVAQCLTG